MARVKPRPTWTDREVALLLTAAYRTEHARALGVESVRPLLERWVEAIYRHACAALGATAHRDRTRRELRTVAKRINAVVSLSWTAGPTTTPEDTLRDAGIDDARQAQYQRRFSTLLAGRAKAGA